MNIKWNADGYTNNFSFVYQYGEGVLELLDVKENMEVIDLGCGNGALTKTISNKGVKVIGIDGSEEMLKIARMNYPDLTFISGDATTFKLQQPVDAIFSNAVFHWIDNQEKLLENISSALKPDGQLVCEFGGKGCTETIHTSLEKAFEKRGYPYPRTFYFPTIGEYTPLMERYGLKVIYATLFDRMTELKGEQGMEEWIKLFAKAPFRNISEEEAEEMIKEAAEATRDTLYRDGKWYADYVRIRIKAIKQ